MALADMVMLAGFFLSFTLGAPFGFHFQSSVQQELTRARVRLDAGDIDGALEPLSRAYELAPENGEVHWMLAVALLRLGRLEEGRTHAETLTKVQPELPRGHALLAAYHDAMGATDAAVEAYLRALELNPSDPQTRHDLAMLYVRTGRDALAIEALLRILERFPNDPRSLVPLGVLYVRQERTEEAVSVLSRAVRVEPRSFETNHYLGALYSKLGRYELARAHLERALVSKADDAHTLFELGLMHARKEELDSARRFFERARVARPDHAPTLFHLAGIAKYESDPAFAESAYKEAIALDERYQQAYRQLGVLYFETGKAESAEPLLRRAVELDPSDGDAHHALARVYDALEKRAEGYRHYERALDLLPFSPEPRLNFGNFLSRRGDRERGREVLSEFRALKDAEDRLKELRAAVDFDPTQPGPKTALVDFLLELGRLDLASEETTRFLSLGSREPMHHALAARVHVARDELSEAEESLLRALELDPDNQEFQESLETLRRDRAAKQ